MNLPKGLWETLSNQTPWQDEHSAKLGDCQRNKLELNLGILNLQLTKSKEVKGIVFAGEILVDPVLLSKGSKVVRFSKFSTFPPAIKDLSLVVEQNIPGELVRSSLEEIVAEITGDALQIEPVSIFDVFDGKGMEQGKRVLLAPSAFGPPIAPLVKRK